MPSPSRALRNLRRSLGVLLAAAGLFGWALAHGAQVTMLAAASLTNAMNEEAGAFEAATGTPVRLSFASSSLLAKQIENGAPAQLYASADEKWMDYLAARGLIETATRVSPIGNALVLIAPASSAQGPVDLHKGTDLLALLPPGGRIAVGDPDHVPAGIYAKEALRWLGDRDAAKPHLARADNVRAALALVERAETPLGIVYATDAAISDKVKIVGRFPKESHDPITYPFAIIKGQDTPEADALLAFLASKAGLAIFEKYGFTAN